MLSLTTYGGYIVKVTADGGSVRLELYLPSMPQPSFAVFLKPEEAAELAAALNVESVIAQKTHGR